MIEYIIKGSHPSNIIEKGIILADGIFSKEEALEKQKIAKQNGWSDVIILTYNQEAPNFIKTLNKNR